MSIPLGERLKVRWTALGLSIQPPASFQAIEQFETTYSVQLPDDLRKTLDLFNGTGRWGGGDKFMFGLWSVQEFVPLSEAYPKARCFDEPESYFLFADSMIMCPAYAIRLSNDTSGENPILRVYSDGGSYVYEPEEGFDSFSEFIEEYLHEGSIG